MTLYDSDLTLADLRAVLAVNDCASFTRAAHKLGISQPAVSRRITQLEGRLGMRLFRREGQRFFPTEAGATFCARATEVLAGVRELENETLGVASSPKGVLGLGVPPSTGEVLLRLVLPEYRRLYPDVKIRVEQGYVYDIFEMLMNRQIDVALLNGRYSNNDVFSEQLYDHDLGIVFPAAWRDASPLGGPLPETLTMEQVARLPLYLPSRNQSLRTLIDEGFHQAGVTVEPDIEINSLVLQKAMVLEGNGCMFMSEGSIRTFDVDRLGFVPISDVSIRYTLHVAVRQFGQPTLATKLMMKLIAAQKHLLADFMCPVTGGAP